MKTRYLLLAVLLGTVGTAFAQEYDDIYYSEPSTVTKTRTSSKGVSKPGTYYVPNMAEVDIDAYNRRGETYYTTPVDTIGTSISEAPDYYYTQQIQQYYNPTIVVSNQSLLDEVLNGSYGNVTIVYAGTTPYFTPYYNYYPTWSINVTPWRWGISYDWYYPWSWYYPSYYYSWGWNSVWWPSYGWGWGGWRPHHSDRWYAHHYRPNMHGNGYVRPGWGSSTRPNIAHNQIGHRPQPSLRPGNNTNTGHRPGTTSRPGSTSVRPGTMTRPGTTGIATTRPGTQANPGNPNIGGHRPSTSTRPGATTTRPITTTTRPGTQANPGNPNSGAHRPSTATRPGTTTSRPVTTTTRPSTSNMPDRYAQPTRPTTTRPTTTRPTTTTRPNTTTSRPTTTRNQNTNTSRPSYNNGSTTHRNTGVSTGSGRSGGGNGGGSGRSGGGGGGGGRHR